MDSLAKRLKLLARRRWQELRHDHNRMFMAIGPGEEWERFKRERAKEFEEIEQLQRVDTGDAPTGPALVRMLEDEVGIAAILEELAVIARENGTGDLGGELDGLAAEVRMNMYG